MTITVNNLNREYGATMAVRELTLRVGTGRTVALVGPSGCGKTTLLRLIAGLEQPDWGEVFLGNTLASNRNYVIPPRQRSLSMVFQDLALWPHMTVRRHVEFALDPRRYRGGARKRRCEELLARVRLTQYDSRPHQLSGGEKQRLALARALAAEPEYLLFDEPLSSLDLASRKQLLGEVRTILRAGNITALYVTHQPEEAIFIADDIALMENGSIRSMCSVSDFAIRQRQLWETNFQELQGRLAGPNEDNTNKIIVFKACEAG